HHYAVGIGSDDVARAYGHAVASHGNVRAGTAVVTDGGGRNDAKRVHREADLLQIGGVSYATVDHCARKISRGHCRAHQPAHALDVVSIFQDHDVHGIGRARIDGV